MNILNIVPFVGIASFVIMMIALFMKSKKSIKVAKVFAVVGLVGIIFFIPAVSNFVANTIPGLTPSTLAIGEPGVTTPSLTDETGACAVDGFIKVDGKCQCLTIDGTTGTFSALNKYTSVATGGTHRVKVNGNPQSTVSNGGTMTLSPGDTVSILWMNGSETISNYFSEISTEIVPCKPTYTFTKAVAPNGTITFDVYNSQKNVINGIANNESLANGDDKDLNVELTGTFNSEQEYGGIIVFEYPSAMLDNIELTIGGLQSKVSNPDFYHGNNGSQTMRTYAVPQVIGSTPILGSLHIDVDDTRNPTATDTDVINWTYYPNDQYIDEKDGATWKLGYQDEVSGRTKAYTVTGAIQLG